MAGLLVGGQRILGGGDRLLAVAGGEVDPGEAGEGLPFEHPVAGLPGDGEGLLGVPACAAVAADA